MLGGLLLASLLVVGISAQPVYAQETDEREHVTLRVLRRLAASPDGAGRRVSTAGRVSVDSGVLHAGETPFFFIQSGKAGVAVNGRVDQPPVTAGDSVVVVGRLIQRQGLAVLVDATYEVIEAPSSVPPSVLLDAATEEALEAYEGRLVTLEGTAVSYGEATAGTYLFVGLEGGFPIVVFEFADHARDLRLDRFVSGDRVALTGILGQYDQVAPYTNGYQLYPRHAGELSGVGLTEQRIKQGGFVALLLLVLLGLGVVILRMQVRRREQALRERELLFTAVYQGAQEALLLVDDAFHVRQANPAAGKLLGTTPEALREATSLMPWVSTEARSDVQVALEEVRQGETPVLEVALQTSGGTPVYAKASLCGLRVDGGFQILVALRDVTDERRATEALIEAKEQAEGMAHRKAAFLTSMSHEMRTPLTSLLGFAAILEEELEDEHIEFVQLMKRASERMLQMVNALLDFARVESDALALTLTPVDLGAHVREAVKLLRPLAERKNLALTVEIPDEEACARLDTDALERVLDNLVNNAIKFTDEGHVHVQVRVEGEAVWLVVRDTGIGIEPELLPDLFTEFTRGGSEAARGREGTGLGLSITRNLVERMHGEITVTSEVGAGTTFRVRWPRVAPEAEDPAVRKAVS